MERLSIHDSIRQALPPNELTDQIIDLKRFITEDTAPRFLAEMYVYRRVAKALLTVPEDSLTSEKILNLVGKIRENSGHIWDIIRDAQMAKETEERRQELVGERK